MKIWIVTGCDEEGIQEYFLCLTEDRADKEINRLELKKKKDKSRIWYYKQEKEALE